MTWSEAPRRRLSGTYHHGVGAYPTVGVQASLPLTPPQTPESTACLSPTQSQQSIMSRFNDLDHIVSTPNVSIPDLDLNSLPQEIQLDLRAGKQEPLENHTQHIWRKGMTDSAKDAREAWLCSGRGRKGLRIVIVTENFLPKVDGVTRTLSRLLEHLQSQGHECILLGPSSTLSTYASHPLVGTLGIPLVVYPDLKLNFLRPKFLSVIRDWEPDVVHFVDPIWLGAQTILAMELGWAGEKWLSQEGLQLGKGLGGAVIASYHTNLATYATLFGLSFLTPIIWMFQSCLYSKLLLTLCPSPSTKSMLESQSFSGVRLWPRGVDLTQFGPHKRDIQLRALWGIKSFAEEEFTSKRKPIITMNTDGILTPPATPWTGPIDSQMSDLGSLDDGAVILYVGRISWEKNLHLLLSAYAELTSLLPNGAVLPKLVFVGDGPARKELESRCENEQWDAAFMGHRQGEELAKCYASADIFAFPSFTETFGQVVLEALASGLPVVGLDAEGTRDLVSDGSTGSLLSLPVSKGTGTGSKTLGLSWAQVCKPDSAEFNSIAKGYASLLSQLVMDPRKRKEMGKRGCTEGIVGYTWWDAMEACVDGYREAIQSSRSKRSVQIVPHSPSDAGDKPVLIPIPKKRGLSLVNQVVSRRLAYKGLDGHSIEDESMKGL
ncbi:uncharacterized protein IL334_001362 [Kwoniella shivajii]|uniref:Glycosyl transferase family 1 domain-containing protein n=1 Tax=Kwoniella shivajii TaxID=564305 RepID=A0ABZ1CTA1_9TREE|nr:hypothetical protein IL334_001362 [Kwoniella shivajii]